MIRRIHRAKFVVAEADLVLNDAAVHVSDPGRISRIEPWHGPPPGMETEMFDWGDAVILPGLVNAHTHLELSDLEGKVPPFQSFTLWLQHVIDERRNWTREQHLASARRGADLAVKSGTTLVGDISASGFSWEALRCRKIRKVVFEETLGLSPERTLAALADVSSRLDRMQTDALLTCGISPHAPYSVASELYREVSGLATERNLPLASHVAETTGELEFLQFGRGELRDFLSRLGALPDTWVEPGLPPVPYLDSLGVLESSPVLIHCNYLDADSMARIHRSQSSVVYCPRSHAYFQHDPHPVRELLDLGVNVAIGTDSLASNSSLSVLDEMRHLFRNRKDLKAEEILRMATLNGAAALGFGGVLGRLRRGYWGDMTVLRLPAGMSDRKLVGEIVEGAGDWAATIVGGEVL
jgi:cytosine/adenosine deaminase-related metal-dependent hydrolase